MIKFLCFETENCTHYINVQTITDIIYWLKDKKYQIHTKDGSSLSIKLNETTKEFLTWLRNPNLLQVNIYETSNKEN